MLSIAIMAYCIYFIVSIYTTFMQIAYIKEAKLKTPIIISSANYKIAGDYAVEKQRIAIVSTLYDFVLLFVWLSFGLEALDQFTLEYQEWQKAIVFIDLFIIINWVLALPIELYTTFKLDKKYGFSNMTPSLYIKDTIKSGILFLVFGSAIIAGLSQIIEIFDSWWIYGFVMIFVVILIINMVYPLVRDKMFDKFEKLKDKELEKKIETLLIKWDLNQVECLV